MLTIYGLQDPITKELRYVGFTSTSLKARLCCHLSDAKRGKDFYRDRWIRTVFEKGLDPEIFIIAETDKEHWQEDERFYISYFRSIGCDLTNTCNGGEGTLGRKHPTDEVQRIKDSNKKTYDSHPELKEAAAIRAHNQIVTEETRAKMSFAKKGKNLTEEHINNIKLALQVPEVKKKLASRTGISMSDEQKKKIGAKIRGTHPTDLARKNMSNAQKINTNKPEVKKKIIETTKQAMSTPTVRQKHLAGIHRYWEMKKLITSTNGDLPCSL